MTYVYIDIENAELYTSCTPDLDLMDTSIEFIGEL